MHENSKILVVDDEESIRNVFRQYLEATDNYTVLTARDGLEALEIIKREGINCCFTDISMPRLDGVALTEKIHAYDNTIPVVVMTGYPTMDNAINTLKNGVVDFLTKPIKMEEIPSTINRVLRERSLFVDNILSKEKNERNEKLLSIHYAFVETIEARDPYTKQHSTRVTEYAVAMAKAMGCSQENMEALNISGTLHDIGKIGVPDNILSKPDRLTDEEYRVIRKHPVIGSNIIGHFNMWAHPQKIIRHHHERWDGNGYPDGLKGEEIPFLSRVLSVADVYDALTSDRSYREKLSETVATRIIKRNAGRQFDQGIVTAFLKLYEQGKLGE
jgi:putative nucleotidyltransferase with HDIG domain